MHIEDIDMDAFHCGEDKTWKQVFECFYRSIVYYIQKKVFDEERAKDVAQLSFMTLFKNKDKIKSSDHIKNFLYLSAKHIVINNYRSIKSRKKNETLSQLGQIEEDDVIKVLDDKEAEEFRLKLFIEIIEKLSEREKRILNDYLAVTDERKTNTDYIAISRLKNKIAVLSGLVKPNRKKGVYVEKILTSKYRGVSYIERTKRWKSFITNKDGKLISLGYFNTEIEAAKRRDEEVKKLNLNKKLNFEE